MLKRCCLSRAGWKFQLACLLGAARCRRFRFLTNVSLAGGGGAPFRTDTVASAPPRGPPRTRTPQRDQPLTLCSFDFRISNLYNFALSGCIFCFQTLTELLRGFYTPVFLEYL